MAECEFSSTCLFFGNGLADMPMVSARLKERYCQGNHARCARYVVRKSLGPEGVPADLFPNEYERARRMLSAFSEDVVPPSSTPL
jgi:hypothetical protein